MALIYNPKVLILDEPMNGWDPDGIVELRLMLRNVNKMGINRKIFGCRTDSGFMPRRNVTLLLEIFVTTIIEIGVFYVAARKSFLRAELR